MYTGFLFLCLDLGKCGVKLRLCLPDNFITSFFSHQMSKYDRNSSLLKPVNMDGVNCPSFPASLFAMLVRWPSRDHVCFYVQCSRRFLGQLKIVWRSWETDRSNVAHNTVASLRRYAVACFTDVLQCTARCWLLAVVAADLTSLSLRCQSFPFLNDNFIMKMNEWEKKLLNFQWY